MWVTQKKVINADIGKLINSMFIKIMHLVLYGSDSEKLILLTSDKSSIPNNSFTFLFNLVKKPQQKQILKSLSHVYVREGRTLEVVQIILH